MRTHSGRSTLAVSKRKKKETPPHHAPEQGLLWVRHRRVENGDAVVHVGNVLLAVLHLDTREHATPCQHVSCQPPLSATANWGRAMLPMHHLDLIKKFVKIL
jgi:hypothetical protein